MISIIGLRGDKFFYEEETYTSDYSFLFDKEDDEEWYSWIGDRKISEYPNTLMAKGAKCMFSGTGQSLVELLETLDKKYAV